MMKGAWHRAQGCGAPLSRYVLPFTIICTSSSLNIPPANVLLVRLSTPRKAVLIALRGKREMRCEIVPRATYSARVPPHAPATRKEHFRRLTNVRVQLTLSPPRSLLAVLVEVPWVLHAKCVGPARRHPALFERAEAAVGGTPVVGTPRTINFGNARARIDHGQHGKGEQDEGPLLLDSLGSCELTRAPPKRRQPSGAARILQWRFSSPVTSAAATASYPTLNLLPSLSNTSRSPVIRAISRRPARDRPLIPRREGLARC